MLADKALAEGFRRCRDAVRGGLERSCLAGSMFALLLEIRFEDDLCNPPAAGLLIFAREGGGRIEASLAVLSTELGGLADVEGRFRDEGLTGSRLGD